MQIRYLTVRRSAIVQYVLIFLILQYAGGRVFAAMGSDTGYFVTLVLCVILGIIYRNALIRNNSYIRFIGILFFLCTLVGILSGGDLSLGTILSLISRFLLIYMAIYVAPDDFSRRMVKLIYIMSIISLIEYTFIILVGADQAISMVFSRLYEIPCGHAWLRSSYGLFLIGFNFMDPTRNAYMFGESGEYQAVIVMALYFIINVFVELEDKQRKRYLLVLFITLITVQSTTGYFAALILLFMLMKTNNQEISKNTKIIVFLGIVLLGVYVMFFASSNSIVYTRFFSKFISEGGIDFTVYTGADRVESIITLGKLLSSDFVSVLLGMGYVGMVAQTGGFLCAGIINFILMFGVITSIYVFVFLWYRSYRYLGKVTDVLCITAIFLNMGLSQPDFMAITSLVMITYPWIYEISTGMALKKREERHG